MEEGNLAAIVEQVYTLVLPLDDQQRFRVMRSVSALFEDKEQPNSNHRDYGGSDPKGRDRETSKAVSASVAAWLSRNGITQDHLDQVFHIENGGVSIIADSVPGATKKEQTVNCYVLEGVRAFLESGSAKFADAAADELCTRLGCRDDNNHTTNRASAGNKLTGSRKDGFTLVAPGLLHASKIIKQIATPTAGKEN